jgi:hypothetical protein
MKTAVIGTIALLSVTLAARADFSYTTSSKVTGGSMGAMAGSAGNAQDKLYFKGQKMKTESADVATIIDFEAQTLTTINHRTKTVTVKKLSEITTGPNDASVTVDVKETGQRKTINGYDAKELVMTMEMSMPQAPQMGKMQMEMQLWLSSDVPGLGEMREFYRKNMERFPWSTMGGANPQMVQAMAQMRRKMAEMNGVQVETVMKVKPAGGAGAPAMPQMPQMTAEQQAQMQAAMARLKQQGGPAADAAAQAMARMGNMGRGPASGASNSLMEITTDSSEFSTAPIPDSVFAIPAGYQKN